MNEEHQEPEDLDNINDETSEHLEAQETITRVSGMFQDWFLDYASYVILERAVPAIEDGFKPVQRRIMHALKELDDGRYNKVANVVGHTMQYHPHGDASIGDAMVQIGQKDLLIDTQGNWGNILTGDRAAASRYIEARLSKFALDVVYNPKITDWQSSYDGRKKEPINLPVMFPLLLAQGAEGIAVGLSTKVLPHNFIELIEASIKHLKGKRFTIVPDFPTGGIADCSDYKDGVRGGKIRVRARLSQQDKNTLVITELPFGQTTTSLIDSILKANDKGKIKIKKIEDNTSANVEILVHLPSGISPDKTIDALYAFTNCESSISPLGCVIENNKPLFVGVTEMLRRSTERTKELLREELEIQRNEFENQWHYASLERIFIENRIYRDIEEEETWEGVIKAIDKGLQPHISHLKRAVIEEDIVRLTEIRIKRISKFDIDKAQQKIDALEDSITQVNHHLAHLTEYAIDYFNRLKKDYGKGKERKTELRIFDDIQATKVVLRNQKLYVNREEGFIGTSLRKNEYVTDCADIDDIIVFTQEGKMMVTRVGSKTFIGKNIIHVAVFKKKDKRTTYNMIYKDGTGGATYVKRFNVTSITRDKEYDLTTGKKGSTVFYFTSNPNGEAEIVNVYLRAVASVKKLRLEIDFSDILIKGRGSKGNIVSKHSVKNVELKEKGLSTLKPRKIWFDETVQRLNVDERGDLLGEFRPDDRLLIINQHGNARTIVPEVTAHFDSDMIVLEKWIPAKPITAIYWDGDKERYYGKRFLIENPDKDEVFISEHPDSQLELVSTDYRPVAEMVFYKARGKDQKPNEQVSMEDFISVKGIKAQGNQFYGERLKQLDWIESLPYEEPASITKEEMEVIGEETIIPEIDPKDIDTQNTNTSDKDISDKSNDSDDLDEGQITLF